MDCGSIETMIKLLKQATPNAFPLMPEYVISRIIAKVINIIEMLHMIDFERIAVCA
jgi:hypothetical protein